MQKIYFIFLFFLVPSIVQSQLAKKEFIIGAFAPPFLVNESATAAPADYNGDGKADLASRINTGFQKGKFLIDYYDNTQSYFKKNGWSFVSSEAIYGDVGDKIINSDYDNDAKADICVYFPEIKTLKIDFAKNGFGKWDALFSYQSDKRIDAVIDVVAGNFDKDKRKDIVFKTASGSWMIDYAGNGLGSIDFVVNTSAEKDEISVTADYDGDGMDDLAVKTNSGIWKIDYYKNGYKGWDILIYGCGDNSEIPVPSDYNGDGRADISVKTNKGEWKVAYSFKNNTNIKWLPQTLGADYGGAEALPYPADFNGDGKTDFSFVFKNDGRWLIDDFSASTNGYDWMSFYGKVTDNFNAKSINPADIANYTKLKDAHFNLTIDGMARLTNNFQKEYYLSLMDKVDLYTMLTDPHIYGYGDINDEVSFNKKQFIDVFNIGLSQKLKDRLYAINLGDEPVNQKFMPDNSKGTMEKAHKWAIFFKKAYPEKPVFANLLPRIYQRFHSDADYLEYLDVYKTSFTTPIVCFDHYPFGAKYFDQLYFSNLRMIKSKFVQQGFWATAWSTISKLNSYLDPDEKQLMFMAFCPIAYGATGITYFPYDKDLNPNFTKAINDDDNKYNYVKNINLFLKNVVGPVVMSSRNIATLHAGNTVLNEGHPFKQDELIGSTKFIIKEANNKHLLLGLFASNDSKKPIVKYVWAVNKDLNNIENVTIKLEGNYVNKIWISPRSFNYVNNPTRTYLKPTILNYNKNSNITSFTIPVINGGEGLMIKLGN